jgi:hypothetical protein
VNQQGFTGVANAVAMALGVDDNPFAHGEVGALVDIDVAVAGEMLDDRHLRISGDAADQALSPARNCDVDVLRK